MPRKAPDGLRHEVEQATLEEVGTVGLASFRRSAIAARFQGRDVHRATLFRWIEAAERSGQPSDAATRRAKAAVAEIIAAAPDPAEAVTEEVLARIPSAVTLADASADPGGVSAVIARFAHIARNLDKLEAHALTPDGKVKNAGLLLKVSQSMTRSLKAACRVRDSLRDDEALERRTTIFMEEIRKESPDCARRIAIRQPDPLRPVAGQPTVSHVRHADAHHFCPTI